ncbi:MAG: EAL domain-containing protein [Prochloraceae cyanobacterium]|nr:EAL domain-containing protein [Prochloraceae cyanobacterium]
MNLFPDYEIETKIKANSECIIYRAIRKSDRKSVIIKTLKKDCPTIQETATLLHEYGILKNLNSKKIVKAYALKREKRKLALILEDFGGESLENFIATKQFKLQEFLQIGIQLSLILDELHQNKIIHKDIKPSNIIFNPATFEVKITDFGIATQLTKETISFKNNLWTSNNNSDLLEGTLAYISPEQTGRMNRAIDYRSDFYSLGVTFYQMLTGVLPFQVDDFLELIHCHIAVTPIVPQQINPEIPKVVSDIIMKLLAKNAENRYQSALGLKADLDNCLSQLLDTGKITSFLPGEIDRSGQFLIPQKLYGRANEVATLLTAFERVGSGGSEILLVSGYSGIGKTSVINEIHKPIVKQRGYFISGKFDQFKRNIPYKAIIEAFQSLIQQLITQSSEQIAQLGEKIRSNLGQNAALIAQVIPEIEIIIGSQPSVPQLGPHESQNRFNRVFKKFVEVFTSKEHPLVIFLDDLQWADLASLKLIQLLVTDSDIDCFLVIGAYRDNEVSSTHPLVKTIEKIEQAKIVIGRIQLKPLKSDSVKELIADTLSLKVTNNNKLSHEFQLLAELILAKTAGNPFFLNTLLQTLYLESLFTFDYNTGVWQWNLQKIQAVGITDLNVVELVASNLKKLPLQTQEILKSAACLGHKFDLNVLAIVNQCSRSETSRYLWPALQNGLILPLSNTYKIPLLFEPKTLKDEVLKVDYKFLHDRVQQAAYSLIPDSDKQSTHLKIGQLLLKQTSPKDREENIFDLVNQLNIGRKLIIERSQKDLLAELNLVAGKKAKLASAYFAACQYLNVGLEQLQVNSWQKDYDLSLALHIEAVEVEYLNANFDRAERLGDIVLQQAQTLLDKVKVYEIKINYYIAQSQMQKALNIALPVLEKLGVNLPKKTNQFKIILALLKTKLVQRNRSIEDLASLPEMRDPYKIAGMRILIAVIPATFVAIPQLFPLTTFEIVNLSLEYGNISLSICGYICYGLIHCAKLGDIDSGYRYGKLGLMLLDRLDATDRKSQTYLIFNNFIRHWKEHIKETIEPLAEGIQSGLETGKIEDACYCAAHYCCYLFLTGEPLLSVSKKQIEYIEFMDKNKQEIQRDQAKVWGQLVLNLLVDSENPHRLIGELFNEEKMLPSLIEVKNNFAVFAAYLAKSLICYLFKEYSESANNSFLAEEYASGSLGSAFIPLYQFYYSLSLLALYPIASKKEQKKYLKKVKSFQKEMEYWAKHAPDNYLHKYQLVEAEKSRILGANATAIEYYQKAIQAARAGKYIQEEALANELAAEFYFSCNKHKQAEAYLIDAYYGYAHWGAVAKVKDLERIYPQILNSISLKINRIQLKDQTKSIRGKTLQVLDLITVIKASQAISSEIVLDKLLSKLMHILMENAGGQRGLLFLEQDDFLILVAEANIGVDNKVVIAEHENIKYSDWPRSLIKYVQRTKQTLILNNTNSQSIFINDPYIAKQRPKSILSFPLMSQVQLRGIVYLENTLLEDAFTEKRLELLKFLTSQVSIAIENARLYENLEYEAFHDSLTNLPNRSLFNHRLSQAINDAIKDRNLVGLMFLDLDRFKKINDTLSHEIGDRLLQSFARRLISCLRESDTLARWGGDEFTILFPKINSKEDVIKITRRIFDSLKEPLLVDKHRLYIQASMGIALYPDHGEDCSTLLKNADSALNKAKQRGKNTYQFYNQKIDSQANYLLKLDNALHEALDRQEFSIHYQPQINGKTGKVVAMEALLRWSHPEFGPISPGRFIPLIEESGLIIPIGEWVLRTACAQNKVWQTAGLPPIKVAVNMSCQQFQQQDLVPMLGQILLATELEPKFLEIEITESTIMEDLDSANRVMSDLQAIGVYLSMDDFGTGYSSLSYLKNFPFDAFKIDRSFVHGMQKDSKGLAILRVLISLAQGLNLQVVAEGVETQDQFKILHNLKCEVFQGYLFSRPLPVQEATKFLAQRSKKS